MDDVIRLDVGGCLYTTTRSTLTRYPDSLLGTMFRRRVPSATYLAIDFDFDSTNSGRLTPPCDAKGTYIIDRDGPIFRFILGFLRQLELNLPDDFKEWDMLAAEADYYELPELTTVVMDTRNRRKMREYVEFIHTTPGTFKYRGSLKVFKEIPEEVLLSFFIRTGWESNIEVYQRIQRFGEIEAPCAGHEYSVDVINLFQAMSQIGFEVSTSSASGAPNEQSQKSWLFARKME